MEGRKQESRARDKKSRRNGRRRIAGGLALVLGAVLAGAATPGLARTRRTHDTKSSITFAVRVYNHARLAPDVLSSAERETDSIFRSAGVEIAWIDCPLNLEQWADYPACQAKFGPADFMVKILPPDMAERAPWPRARLAHATECGPDLTGCWAAISYRKVENLALMAEVPFPMILGKVMAHELGHLLLGPDHSPTGIMRAALDTGNFEPGRLPSLVFLDAQRERLRAAVVAAHTTTSAAR